MKNRLVIKKCSSCSKDHNVDYENDIPSVVICPITSERVFIRVKDNGYLFATALSEKECLYNLLAIVHGDGGHNREANGYEKSTELAMDKISKLKGALHDVIDATEDKGGQFLAWHNHLREATKQAKELL